MAHFAEVIDGTVVRVVVVSNGVTYRNGTEDEQRGVDHLDGLLPTAGVWVQCSYNSTFRYNMAGIGSSWDGTGFAHPQPYLSWSLDSDYQWQPPAPYPDTDDLAAYGWDETAGEWVAV